MAKGRCIVMVMVLLSALPGLVASQDAGDAHWIIRTRIISVSPSDASAMITTTGSEIGVDSAIAPEIDLMYRFARHWGIELTLFTAKHQFETVGGAIGGMDAGDAWILPPTITFQYWIPVEGKVQPYVGLGLNYTSFYGYDLSDDLRGLGLIELDFEPSFGFAGQLGADFTLGRTWSLNLDVKYIDISTDVELRRGAPGLLDTVSVDVDPWVFGLGLGWAF